MKKIVIGIVIVGIFSVVGISCKMINIESERTEISPILEYAKEIMNGERRPSGDEPLKIYSDIGKNQSKDKIEIIVREIDLNQKENEGYIVVDYTIENWGDGSAKWFIEKKAQDWEVVNVYDRPDGYIPET